jgi:DNA repair exonuclease SbcCD ATPase subunit
MSGCHPTETLSLCPHGNPVKFGRCLACDPIKRIPDLHMDFLAGKEILDVIRKELQENKNRIEALHEHKLRQIDENRKISRRVDEIEKIKGLVSSSLDETLCDIDKDISKLNERLDRIDHKCVNHITSIFKRLEELESKFDDLSVKSKLNSQKQPFKCPVCSGAGDFHVESLQDIQALGSHRIDGMGRHYTKCHACNDGIVWG